MCTQAVIGFVSLEGLGTTFREVVPDFVVVIGNHFEERLGMNEARWDGWRVVPSKICHPALREAVLYTRNIRIIFNLFIVPSDCRRCRRRVCAGST